MWQVIQSFILYVLSDILYFCPEIFNTYPKICANSDVDWTWTSTDNCLIKAVAVNWNLRGIYVDLWSFLAFVGILTLGTFLKYKLSPSYGLNKKISWSKFIFVFETCWTYFKEYYEVYTLTALLSSSHWSMKYLHYIF